MYETAQISQSWEVGGEGETFYSSHRWKFFDLQHCGLVNMKGTHKY